MVWLFEDSIDEIIQLVKDQAAQVESYNGVRRVKVGYRNIHKKDITNLNELQKILMTGGFGESIYLQSAIRENLWHRQIKVNSPAQS